MSTTIPALQNQTQTQQLWKTRELKAKKTGNHCSMYSVKRQRTDYEANMLTNLTIENPVRDTARIQTALLPQKPETKWKTASVYTGAWKDDLRHGLTFILLFLSQQKYSVFL